jgi:hypothetical protein
MPDGSIFGPAAAYPAHAADGPGGARRYARPQRASSAQWNAGLCAGWLEGSQLMRMSLGSLPGRI